MFIFKKFQKQNSDLTLNATQTNKPATSGRGVHPMGQNLQRKFARGIQYNMKIIIRGDRNVGKTCLFHRLQGEKFRDNYVPSEEIQVASIQWNYNASDDVVKVEIWDVVDKGKKRESSTNSAANGKDVLKMHNNSNEKHSTNNGETASENTSPVLDAEFIDVYKGTNGVIFLFDMTKAWTFEYIEREIRRCPPHIPVLILANHRDMGHHRVITSDQIQGLIDSVLQEDNECGRTRTGQIRHAESSMRNSFGLRFLYKFFNLPYLQLQRETLLKQLERNLDEIEGSCQELDLMAESDENNYDIFLEMITNRRRVLADQLSSVPKNNPESMMNAPTRSMSVPANMASTLGDSNRLKNSNDSNGSNGVSIVKPTPSIIIGANNPLPPKFQQQVHGKASNLKSLSNSLQRNIQNNSGNSNNHSPRANFNASVKNLEDFVPDDMEHNIFRKFLDEPNLPQDIDNLSMTIEEESDDEDNLDNNPMVAKYQEELDPEDLVDDNQMNNTSHDISSGDKPNNHVQEIEDNLSNNIEVSSDNDQIQCDDINRPSNAQDDLNVDYQLDKPSVIIVEDDESTLNNEQSLTLNCDDIDAFENLYISKEKTGRHISQDSNTLSSGVFVSSEASSECSSVKSTGKKKSNKTQVTKRKKTKCEKTVPNNGLAGDTNSTDADVSGAQSTSVKKNTKSQLKTKQNKSKSKKVSEEDILAEERRQLEQFLGADDYSHNDGQFLTRSSLPDQTAYEVL